MLTIKLKKKREETSFYKRGTKEFLENPLFSEEEREVAKLSKEEFVEYSRNLYLKIKALNNETSTKWL